MDKNDILEYLTEGEEDTVTQLKRPCTQEEFDEAYRYQKLKSITMFRGVKKKYSKINIAKVVLTLFPVIKWLPKYDFKKDLVYDLASGFTVAVMHVPQGMAYAALGAVNPIVGVYMAIFPILIYFLMSTSRHISLGSFSIVCLMAGKPVVMYSTRTNATVDSVETNPTYSPEQVASVICFTAGMFQVVLGVCKVGSLSMFLSESLISGFTTGAAVLVFVSQLKHVFGVEIPFNTGLFDVIYTFKYLFKTISSTNIVALLMALSVIACLLIYSRFVQPRLKCKFLLPIELVVMIISTVLSYLLDLENKYSINVVGPIPTGIIAPQVPMVKLIPDIYLDSLIIAAISFSINISMATIFAMKDNYKIDPNQELLASGFGNMFGGFFSCLPIATSLSRSMLQYTSGGKTQLASLFSSIILLSVILYFGKFLKPLPYCCLAGIVIACLKSMILQIKNLPEIWKHSTIDGIIWVLTFLSVVFLDIHIGLVVALILAFLSIIYMNQKIYVCLLGQVPNTDTFLEISRYPTAKTIPSFIIVKVYAGLHFANIHVAKNKIERLINEAISADSLRDHYFLIIDMSGVLFMDPAAVHELQIFTECVKRQNITVSFSHCSGRVYEQIMKCTHFVKFLENALFPTVQDAVSYVIKQNEQVVGQTQSNEVISMASKMS